MAPAWRSFETKRKTAETGLPSQSILPSANVDTRFLRNIASHCFTGPPPGNTVPISPGSSTPDSKATDASWQFERLLLAKSDQSRMRRDLPVKANHSKRTPTNEAQR